MLRPVTEIKLVRAIVKIRFTICVTEYTVIHLTGSHSFSHTCKYKRKFIIKRPEEVKKKKTCDFLYNSHCLRLTDPI